MHRFRTATRAAGLVVGAILAMALAAPTLANTGHQGGWNVAWDDTEFQGAVGECDGIDLDEGQVLWHFVQTKVASDAAAGELTATFDEAGSLTTVSYQKAGGALHWVIVTGQDALHAFSSDVTSDGQLNLSHICAAQGDGDPADQPSDDPADDPADQPSDDPADDTSSQEPSDDSSQDPESGTPTAAPGGTTGGALGTPKVTPPPTDSVGADASGSSTGWLLAVTGLAALVMALAVTAPSRRTSR
jgi:hypothetical protein